MQSASGDEVSISSMETVVVSPGAEFEEPLKKADQRGDASKATHREAPVGHVTRE